jgi:ATP-dependent RNA helicase DHX33
VPQFLHEAGYTKKGIIGVTQTRRVAATSLAVRVSEEQGAELGNLVGYSVRFDDMTSSSTRIKFLTDGMLVHDLLFDPLLKSYSVIIVDEAHERTLRTDLLISRLKDIQKQRNHSIKTRVSGVTNSASLPNHPLKVVIMSATLDAEKFSRFYNK